MIFLKSFAFLGMELSEWIQIIVGLSSFFALLISIITIRQNKKAYDKSYEYQKKKFGLDISKECATFFTDEVSAILRPFLNKDLNELINKFTENGKKVCFDHQNLERRINELEYGDFKNTDQLKNHIDSEVKKFYNNDEEKIREFIRQRTYVLNKLEYFGMCFITGMADEELVYPSLHQVYLKTVNFLSIYICYTNRKSEHNYYVYLKQLYEKWNEKQKEANECKESLDDVSKKTADLRFTPN